MEAQACGTPVVATHTTCLPEAVADGLSGRLCPVDDVTAFADAIRTLTSDTDQLRAAAAAARRWAEEKLDVHRMLGAYLSLLFDVTSCPSLSSRS